ncbi:hypothetical protein Tco_0692315, partial [Tanacetum coccineum]
IAPVAIIDRQLPFEYTIACRSTDLMVSARDAPSTTASIGMTSPINYGNKNGMEEGNIGTCSTPIGTTAPNTGPTSYAKLVTGEPIKKSVNFHTLFTPAGNGVDLVVPVESIRAVSERNTWGKYGLVKSMLNSSTRIFSVQFSSMDGLDAMLENGPWSSYARALIEIRADVELKDNIVVAMPKLEECPKTIDVGVAKNLKKPSQAPRGVPVGPNVGFKPPKQVYRAVSKKPNANTSGNKKKDVEPKKEVSNSNSFDVLNSVENDMDLGSNWGTSNLASKDANPISLVDDEGKPLKKVDYPVDHDNENEIASVDNNMTCFLASERVGFDTNSLLEQ